MKKQVIWSTASQERTGAGFGGSGFLAQGRKGDGAGLPKMLAALSASELLGPRQPPVSPTGFDHSRSKKIKCLGSMMPDCAVRCPEKK